MNSKNYIIEEWVENILVHPLTKNKIKMRDIVNKKNIPDATIFLKIQKVGYNSLLDKLNLKNGL